ncbi:hypothetical protein [Streptosporangium sp. NPDC002607]
MLDREGFGGDVGDGGLQPLIAQNQHRLAFAQCPFQLGDAGVLLPGQRGGLPTFLDYRVAQRTQLGGQCVVDLANLGGALLSIGEPRWDPGRRWRNRGHPR